MGLQQAHCHGLRAGGSRCQKDCRLCSQLWALRMYRCHRCGKVTLVCSRCDHGHRYCAGACRHHARKESLQRAGQRYQQSAIGRRKHAARMAAHRRTRQQKVTHQGIPECADSVVPFPPGRVVLPEEETPNEPPVEEPPKTDTQDSAPLCESQLRIDGSEHGCHFCQLARSRFLRRDSVDTLRRRLRARATARRPP
jgi:hypothetical protein